MKRIIFILIIISVIALLVLGCAQTEDKTSVKSDTGVSQEDLDKLGQHKAADQVDRIIVALKKKL